MNRQSGSALWLILMAVALLAALAIAITRSSGTAEQNGGVEHNRIVASQLMRYASGLEAAIDQMRLRGVSESDLDFDTAALTGYVNPACTVDDCKIFMTGGGAQTYILPPGVNDGSPWLFTAQYELANIGAADQPDLIALLPGISQSLCQTIDGQVGLASPPAITSAVTAVTKFIGSYDSTTPADLGGKPAGCFTDSNGVNVFYQVLLAR